MERTRRSRVRSLADALVLHLLDGVFDDLIAHGTLIEIYIRKASLPKPLQSGEITDPDGSIVLHEGSQGTHSLIIGAHRLQILTKCLGIRDGRQCIQFFLALRILKLLVRW